MVAQAALALAPIDAARLDLAEHGGPELWRHLRAAREVVEALADAPDGELVRVEDAGELVVVEKRGDSLHVQVHDGEDDVEVNVPLDVVLEAVPADGRIDASALVGALRQARLTKLADVRSGGDHVQISIWSLARGGSSAPPFGQTVVNPTAAIAAGSAAVGVVRR